MIQISSAKEYFDTLPQRFVAAGARGVNAVYQFELSSGEGDIVKHIKISDGKMEIVEGPFNAPSATFKTSAENLVGMANGTISYVMLYMKGQMKIGGNIMLAQKVPAFLPPSKPNTPPRHQ